MFFKCVDWDNALTHLISAIFLLVASGRLACTPSLILLIINYNAYFVILCQPKNVAKILIALTNSIGKITYKYLGDAQNCISCTCLLVLSRLFNFIK